MAADVRECAGAQGTPVPPAHRCVLVEPVVAPVVPVEVHHPAERAVADLLTNRIDGRRPPECEADRSYLIGLLGGLHHCLRVCDGRRQRLLTEHVLAGRKQRLDDWTVQIVGHHDADRVDVRRVNDRLPARLGTFVAITLCRIYSKRFVSVGDGNKPDVR